MFVCLFVFVFVADWVSASVELVLLFVWFVVSFGWFVCLFVCLFVLRGRTLTCNDAMYFACSGPSCENLLQADEIRLMDETGIDQRPMVRSAKDVDAGCLSRPTCWDTHVLGCCVYGHLP